MIKGLNAIEHFYRFYWPPQPVLMSKSLNLLVRGDVFPVLRTKGSHLQLNMFALLLSSEE